MTVQDRGRCGRAWIRPVELNRVGRLRLWALQGHRPRTEGKCSATRRGIRCGSRASVQLRPLATRASTSTVCNHFGATLNPSGGGSHDAVAFRLPRGLARQGPEPLGGNRGSLRPASQAGRVTRRERGELELARHCGVQPGRGNVEAAMTTPRRVQFATLGWQTWSFVVIVLVIVLAAAFIMLE